MVMATVTVRVGAGFFTTVLAEALLAVLALAAMTITARLLEKKTG